MRIPNLSALLLAAAAPGAASNLAYITFGPMLHWNFSGYRFSAFSVGLECALWNHQSVPEDESWVRLPDVSRPGYGLDFGIDLDKHGLRFYSEPQLGWVYAGVSAGPVMQLPWRGGRPSFGFQGSGWANALGGLDFRYRRQAGRNHLSPGLYVKFPFKAPG